MRAKLILFTLPFILLGCAKEKGARIRGRVVHFYTQKAIKNYPIEIRKSSAGLMGSNDQKIGQTFTDANGYFEAIISDFSDRYWYSFSGASYRVTLSDTTQKFFDVGIHVTDFTGITHLGLKPRGYLYVGIDSSITTTYHAETVEISSPYVKETVTRIYGRAYFYVDADRSHVFKFHLKGPGIDTNIDRTIYVRDYETPWDPSSSASVVSYLFKM